MSPNVIQYEVYNITYEVLSPKRLNLNLIKSLDLTLILQKNRRNEGTTQGEKSPKCGTFYNINGLVSSNKSISPGKKRWENCSR